MLHPSSPHPITLVIKKKQNQPHYGAHLAVGTSPSLNGVQGKPMLLHSHVSLGCNCSVCSVLRLSSQATTLPAVPRTLPDPRGCPSAHCSPWCLSFASLQAFLSCSLGHDNSALANLTLACDLDTLEDTAMKNGLQAPGQARPGSQDTAG